MPTVFNSGGHAEPVIGRAFARPVGFAHPCIRFNFQTAHFVIARSHRVATKHSLSACFPSPPRSGGEGSRVGVAPQIPLSANALIDPPPPTPPRHALTRAEGGEKKTEFKFSNSTSHSRGAFRPSFALLVPPSFQRAQGKPGVRCTRSRACSVGSTRVSHHEYTGSPGIPERDGVNGFLRALPGDRALLPPSSLRSLPLKNLTPASGCQDHTTSPSASAPFVKGASTSTASRTQRS